MKISSNFRIPNLTVNETTGKNTEIIVFPGITEVKNPFFESDCTNHVN